MATTRQQGLITLATLALAGCTWGRSKPEDCARYAVSPGNVRVEQIASAAGAPRVTIAHHLCSDKQERLGDLVPAGRSEVGWCTHIKEEVPATATAVSSSVQQWCAIAVQRRIAYADWSSAIGSRFLFVAAHEVLESERSPGPNGKWERR